MVKTTRPARPIARAAIPGGPPPGQTPPADGRGAEVLAWRDPEAGTTLRRPRPRPAAMGLAIEGPTPLPGAHPPGSGGFGYWATAEALVRAVSVWRAAIDWPWHWPRAGTLPVRLESATFPAAGYGREGIFLRRTGMPVPACRAIGHAVLDALCPALWDAAATEAATLHNAFADITAVLASLEIPECRAGVLNPGAEPIATGLRALCGYPSSPLTAPLLELIALLFRSSSGRGRSADAALCLASGKAARAIATAVRRMAVAPNILAQAASELAIATMEAEAPAVALGLRETFAQAGLLPRSPTLDRLNPYEAEDGTERVPLRPALSWIMLDATCLGLDRPLLVQPAAQTPLLALARDGSGNDPAHPVAEARRFALALFAQGRVEPLATGRRPVRRRSASATHRLVDEGVALRLCRLRFLCD